MNEVLGALATWRIARMITNSGEEGPFSVFAKIRNLTAQQRNWIERGMWCIMCVSLWVGLAVSLLMGKVSLRDTIVRGIGFSGASVILHKLFQ